MLKYLKYEILQNVWFMQVDWLTGQKGANWPAIYLFLEGELDSWLFPSAWI